LFCLRIGDDFTIPYNAPEDERLEQLKSFKQEIIKASPKTKVIIPKYFEPIVLKQSRKTAINKVTGALLSQYSLC
jgi:hypothetical protein